MEKEKLLDYLSKTEDNKGSQVTSETKKTLIQDEERDKQEFQDIVEAVSKVVMEQDQESVEERSAQIAASQSEGEGSQFFADPRNPQPSEWSDWPPEKWVEWSESEEYRELYTDPANSYRPPQVSRPDQVPILDYREKLPVILTKLSTTARPPSTTDAQMEQTARPMFAVAGEDKLSLL